MFVLKSFSPAFTDSFLQKLKMYDLSSHKFKLLKLNGIIKFPHSEVKSLFPLLTLPFFTEEKISVPTKHKKCKKTELNDL